MIGSLPGSCSGADDPVGVGSYVGVEFDVVVLLQRWSRLFRFPYGLVAIIVDTGPGKISEKKIL